MARKLQLGLHVSAGLEAEIAAMARECGCDRQMLLARALALFKVAHEAREAGLHVGAAADPARLETEYVGIIGDTTAEPAYVEHGCG
jgi:hypothetical protein